MIELSLGQFDSPIGRGFHTFQSEPTHLFLGQTHRTVFRRLNPHPPNGLDLFLGHAHRCIIENILHLISRQSDGALGGIGACVADEEIPHRIDAFFKEELLEAVVAERSGSGQLIEEIEPLAFEILHQPAQQGRIPLFRGTF